MERIGVDDSKSATFETLEHLHRYHWAKEFAVGRVLDIACGVGYGADLLMKSRTVSEYVGSDNSIEAITEAVRHFLGPKRRFNVAEGERLPYPDDTFDSVVMLETLEHVTDPEEVVREVRRVLKRDGVLIGSVPTQNYEKLCKKLWGDNPYHLTEFTERGLRRLLTKRFKNPVILTCCLEVASRVNFDYPRAPDDRSARVVQLFGEDRADLGSFLFLAGNVKAKRLSKRSNEIALGISYLVQENVLHDAIRRADEFVEERDALIQKQATMVEERDADIKALEGKLTDLGTSSTALEESLRQTIADQTALIDEREAYMKKLDQTVRGFRNTVRDQAKLVEERDALIQKQATMVEERDAQIRRQSQMVEERDALIREQAEEI